MLQFVLGDLSMQLSRAGQLSLAVGQLSVALEPAGLDDGLLPLPLPILFYMWNPYTRHIGTTNDSDE